MSVAQATSRIALDWPDDPAYRAVGRLVLSGVASRVDLPVDRVEELGIALDSLARSPVTGGRLRLEVDVTAGRLVVRIGAFVSDPLADPAIRRVVVALADGVETGGEPGRHHVLLTIPSAG